MKTFSKIFLIASFIFSGHLMAADLTSAKAAGIIGEQANGYIGFVKSASDDVKTLVSEVNSKRKARYKKIAKAQKISLNEVEKIGGKKVIEKTKSGNYIKRAGKGWTKKK
jgi:uncharacterized protein